jgi:hypothetical protein
LLVRTEDTISGPQVGFANVNGVSLNIRNSGLHTV